MSGEQDPSTHIFVTKRDGQRQLLNETKLQIRLERVARDLRQAVAVQSESSNVDETTNSKGSIYIYTDGFEIIEIYPEYLKEPNKVWSGTYNSLNGTYTIGQPAVNCDLPEHTHSEIVDLAVLECSRIIEHPQFYQLRQQKIKENE